MAWTKKHTDLAILKRLTKSALILWEWLVHEKLEGRVETVDLKDFNRYIANKQGKPYDNRTVKSAALRLQEAGIVSWSNFTQFVRRVTVKSLHEFIPPKLRNLSSKDCNLVAQNADLGASNALSVEQEDLAVAADLISQLDEQVVVNLETNTDKLEAVGINFDSQDAAAILAFEDPEEIDKAIALFFKRGGHQKISNPEGWMRRCLEKRWFDKPQFRFVESLLCLAQLVGVKT